MNKNNTYQLLARYYELCVQISQNKYKFTVDQELARRCMGASWMLRVYSPDSSTFLREMASCMHLETVKSHQKSDPDNRRVFAGRTIVENFISIRFEMTYLFVEVAPTRRTRKEEEEEQQQQQQEQQQQTDDWRYQISVSILV